MKKVVIAFGIFLVLLPYLVNYGSSHFIGNLFNNTWGTTKDFFGTSRDSGYEGALSEDVDKYMNENRFSINYEEFLSCALMDVDDDPSNCYENHDEEGHILSNNSNKEYYSIEWDEWNGHVDDEFFKEIHVLGKYTTSNWEKVGTHTETKTTGCILSTSSGSKKVDNSYCENKVSGSSYGAFWETTTEEIDDYDWVYHPEIKRGKCEETDEQKCNIILEDKDVYPYQWPTFNLMQRYGVHVDETTAEVTVANYQIWTGQSIYAFSKGTIIEKDDNYIKLKLDANGIDMYALYETNDGRLISDFNVNDVVEATEEIARNEGEKAETFFYLFNSANQYINPYLFLDSENQTFVGLGEGTIIYGYEDFTPDFSNLDAYINNNGYYKSGYCGQCTWFAKGLFIQHYGFDPKFHSGGSFCASEAYNECLKDKGWTFSKSPSPGAIFSTIGWPHVGIVAGVIDDDTMIIVEANMNGKNDTYQEFQQLPDWRMTTVSTHDYFGLASYEFCNPPQH